jgi:hypothetical protein
MGEQASRDDFLAVFLMQMEAIAARHSIRSIGVTITKSAVPGEDRVADSLFHRLARKAFAENPHRRLASRLLSAPGPASAANVARAMAEELRKPVYAVDCADLAPGDRDDFIEGVIGVLIGRREWIVILDNLDQAQSPGFNHWVISTVLRMGGDLVPAESPDGTAGGATARDAILVCTSHRPTDQFATTLGDQEILHGGCDRITLMSFLFVERLARAPAA